MTDLTKIQLKMEVPKGLKNTFGNYYYRNCEQILAAVKPFLEEFNCSLSLTDEVVMLENRDNLIPTTDKNGVVTSTTTYGNRFYVKSTALFADSTGKETTSIGWAREEDDKKGMDASQITGAASSYARKYALAGLLLLDGEKDADATNTEVTTTKKPDATTLAKKIGSNVITEEKAKELWKEWRDYGLTQEEIKEVLLSCGYKSSYSITEDKIALVNSAMKNKVG